MFRAVCRCPLCPWTSNPTPRAHSHVSVRELRGREKIYSSFKIILSVLVSDMKQESLRQKPFFRWNIADKTPPFSSSSSPPSTPPPSPHRPPSRSHSGSQRLDYSAPRSGERERENIAGTHYSSVAAAEAREALILVNWLGLSLSLSLSFISS